MKHQWKVLKSRARQLKIVCVFSFQRKEISTTADLETVPANSPVAMAMGTCHSLTIIEKNVVGDPLDIKMFEFFKWVATLISFLAKFTDIRKFSSYHKVLHDCAEKETT
jgi:magnesium-transporting ATPase (P-type)